MPLAHPPADFGDSVVAFTGVEQKAHILVMELPHSEGVARAPDRPHMRFGWIAANRGFLASLISAVYPCFIRWLRRGSFNSLLNGYRVQLSFRSELFLLRIV